MTREELEVILKYESKRVYADLHGVDLSNTNLRNIDLSYTNLTYANLKGADLTNANLYKADLHGANLCGTNLSNADLSHANLRYTTLERANLKDAELICANLSDANLHNANLEDVSLEGANLKDAELLYAKIGNVFYDESTAFFALCCPEEGSFIAFKKTLCCYGLSVRYAIVKLEIPSDALRSSATSRKCRASKATVLGFYNLDKTEITKDEIIEYDITFHSTYDRHFTYELGKTYIIDDFETNRWKECASGIHFFMTFDEAKNYGC